MFAKLWEKVGEGLAGVFAPQALGPALLFWAGGLLVLGNKVGWTDVTNWLGGPPPLGSQLAVILGALIVLAVSAEIGGWLDRPALQVMEGYLPWPLRRLRFAAGRRCARAVEQREKRWQELAKRAKTDSQSLSEEELSEVATLDAELGRYPVDRRHVLPTRLGNILRGAEEHAEIRYGLEICVVWPRLWLVLPGEVRGALTAARQRLSGATQLFLWAVFFAGWACYSLWALPVAAVGATVSYWAMVSAGGTYAELLRSTFDLYRFVLYEQVRWPVPKRPEDEKVAGEGLTKFLFRGIADKEVVYVVAEREERGR